MNTLKDIYIDKAEDLRHVTVTLFYASKLAEWDKEIPHCEIFKLAEIKRISLSGAAFTLIYKSGTYLKISIQEGKGLKAFVELVNIRFKSALNVIEHFAKLGYDIGTEKFEE